ncbi:MAG: hypothetical protein ACPGID_05615 [Rubricella sp.]
MRYRTLGLGLALILGLSACGTTVGDRALSGGAIGGGAAALAGTHVGAGIVIGAGIGALTDSGDIYLGQPIWD